MSDPPLLESGIRTEGKKHSAQSNYTAKEGELEKNPCWNPELVFGSFSGDPGTRGKVGIAFEQWGTVK